MHSNNANDGLMPSILIRCIIVTFQSVVKSLKHRVLIYANKPNTIA